MTPSPRPFLRRAWALLGLVLLGSCGGGNDGGAPSLPQIIGFSLPANLTFGTLPQPLVANASSGLAVTLESSTPAVCTVGGTAFAPTLTLVAAGPCTVTASQAGNAAFQAAPPVTRTATVAPAPQTLTFVSPGNQTLGTAPAPLVASASSGLPVAFASSTPAVCGVNGPALALLAAGPCTVTASQAGNANVAPATPVSHTFTVAGLLQAQTLSFASPGAQTLGTAPPPLAATASSGLPVSFTSVSPAVCAVAGSTLTLLAAGDCIVAASQAGDTTFAAADTVLQSFGVSRAAQTVSFASPGNQTLGGAPLALAASASSGLAVTFTTDTPDVCTVSGNALTLVAAGTCSVTARQAGNATFNPAAPVSNSILLSKAAQTISFASPGNQTLGTTPPALAATASSGLPVTLASTTPSVCTVSGSTLTLVTAGTCIVDASQAGNATFAAATTVSRVFTVAAPVLTAQTISFTSPGNQTLGTTPPALVATASSGLPVTLTSTTPSTCTVSGSTLTLVTAGTCIVDASQAGNGTYAAAPTVSRVFTVTATSLTAQTISFVSPGNQTMGTAPPALVATASSGLPVSFASTTPSTCSVSGTTLTLVAAGTCIVDASQAGNGTFAAAPTVSRVITITQVAQSIIFAGPGNQTLGTTPPVLVATASSGLPVTLSTNSADVCGVNGNTLTLVAAGTCSISARQNGNAIYAAASVVTVTLQVSQLTQTITFASPGNQTLGTTPPALVATASSGLPVSLGSATPAVCSVSGSTLTLLAAGTCTVSASQPGNATYAAAAPVQVSFTVSTAALTAQSISFAAPATQTFGNAPFALSATATSGLTVSFATSTPGVCTVSGSTLTLVGAGTCTVVASQAGNATYAGAANVSASFTVLQAAQSLTFNPPGAQTVGAAVTLSASATSGLAVSFSSGTTGVCTVSGSTLTLVAAGTCTITASQAGDTNYSAASPVTQSFTVGQTSQTITFTSPGNQTLGSTPPALVATASSGLAVSISSNTPSICTVSGATLTLVSAGTCSLTARQDGNAVYAAAPLASVAFQVLQVAQTITFAGPGTQTLLSTPPALSATATSSLPVSFASTTPSVCTVSGSTLTLVAAGTCIVDASQAGNTVFAAAPTVSRTFTVNKAAQTVSFTGPGNQTLRVATPALSASASSGLPSFTFSSSTTGVCTVSGTTLTLESDGTCTLTATQAGDATYEAASASVSLTVAKYELFANGGFETAGATTPANAWLAAASGYSRSTDARTGSFSLRLASVQFNAAVALQNSVEQGGRLALVVGSSPTLTFWAKGTAGRTGNVLFALRYLDGVGNIKANSQNQFFQGQISATTWTEITFNLGVVPAGSVAAFIEFSQAIGPIDSNNLAGEVLIDDLSLK